MSVHGDMSIVNVTGPDNFVLSNSRGSTTGLHPLRELIGLTLCAVVVRPGVVEVVEVVE